MRPKSGISAKEWPKRPDKDKNPVRKWLFNTQKHPQRWRSLEWGECAEPLEY